MWKDLFYRFIEEFRKSLREESQVDLLSKTSCPRKKKKKKKKGKGKQKRRKIHA